MVYLTATFIIFALFIVWVIVQHLSRAYARRHPEFGPAREEGGGCGRGCRCAGAYSDTPCPYVEGHFHHDEG